MPGTLAMNADTWATLALRGNSPVSWMARTAMDATCPASARGLCGEEHAAEGVVRAGDHRQATTIARRRAASTPPRLQHRVEVRAMRAPVSEDLGDFSLAGGGR